ncbi:hypothetical protein A1O3_09125 [Capronia epimyces CBS 606.96]|uniref:Signal peptidase complex subunit 2 n=1 Tax=Capronia epimyces CBS 606.96 TaxID=1182542 RepID=W9XLX0_9EURO|nr:uncharacterized protein A1O3_09125 [Capronia epimyces CBS 606.96]EXJ77966.1 hypothetical protein A1O3_09125 [Capronia epimyces CBS 606.96]
MSSSPQKVSLYSANDLKNATDDALTPYLTSLPKPYTFQQQHSTTNVRLALGYTAVIIAGVLFYADYKLGWNATKAYTGPACLAYFALNGALTYWIWAVEAGVVFVGTREGGQKLTLKSSTRKYDPTYKLKVTYEAPSGKKWEDKEIEGSFTQWFNTYGYLQKKDLQAWLANNIEVLGLAENEKEKASQGKKSTHSATTIPLKVDDGPEETKTETLSTATEPSAVLSTTSAKKGRSKKRT